VGNVRATVNVSYDEKSEEHTDEVYDPDETATLTTQKTEQTNGGSRVASGVPGTASNAPAAAAVGAVQGSDKAAAPSTPPLLQKDPLPVFPQNGSAGQSLKEESGTFAVTRHLTHTEAGPGRVRRVTAAVVVNDRMVPDTTAKVVKTAWKPRSADEMRRLESLAKAAVGFDETRGDSVVMENVSFSSNVPEPPAVGIDKAVEETKGLLQSQPGVLKTVVTGLLGLVLLMAVLRPVSRQVVLALKPPVTLADGRVVSAEEALALAALAAAKPELGPGAEVAGGLGSGSESEMSDEERAAARFAEVSAHIKNDPTHSTRLLESWISTDGDD
jgi:flagellar M-ring protein FliF